MIQVILIKLVILIQINIQDYYINHFIITYRDVRYFMMILRRYTQLQLEQVYPNLFFYMLYDILLFLYHLIFQDNVFHYQMLFSQQVYLTYIIYEHQNVFLNNDICENLIIHYFINQANDQSLIKQLLIYFFIKYVTKVAYPFQLRNERKKC